MSDYWINMKHLHKTVKRVCGHCLRETTDQQWFGSACFKGTCKPARIWDDTFIYELEHRRPKGTDWRYAPAGSPACWRYYA